jgi:hypothetical protein
LDSLIGAIDLSRDRRRPYLVSQVSQGDKKKQILFASRPGNNERSQRARSIIFLAYAVLLATALKRYHDGEEIPLFVCENGFISINPPLTTGRLGSLSTRTAHPVFLTLFQRLLDSADLNVRMISPFCENTPRRRRAAAVLRERATVTAGAAFRA